MAKRVAAVAFKDRRIRFSDIECLVNFGVEDHRSGRLAMPIEHRGFADLVDAFALAIQTVQKFHSMVDIRDPLGLRDR